MSTLGEQQSQPSLELVRVDDQGNADMGYNPTHTVQKVCPVEFSRTFFSVCIGRSANRETKPRKRTK